MKFKWSVLLYSALCNLPVSFFLCLGGAIAANTNFDQGVITIYLVNVNWFNILWNFLICYFLAICIGVFVPLTLIGKWFAGLFHVKNDTYTGNVPYRLLATLSSSVIFYLGITPVITILNFFVFRSMSWNQTLLNMIIQAPMMLLIGFVSSLISDIFAFRVAHKYDPTF